MSQKVSKKQAADHKDAPSGTGKQLQNVFGKLYYLYEQNDKLWKHIAEVERSNVELRSLIKGVA